MARYIDADNLIDELSAACMPIYEKDITGILGDNSSIADIINEQPTADVQEARHGKWIFHEKTKLVPSNKVGIKEEYTNGHDCTVVDNTNVNKKIMIMKKHITVRVPVCSVCGWCGYDEYNATNYCPNCGARMDGDNNARNIISW